MAHGDNNIIGFIKSGIYRYKILKLLNILNYASPSDLSKKLDVSLPQISMTLSELKKVNLVNCTTPTRSKGKIYRLTENGLLLIKILEGV